MSKPGYNELFATVPATAPASVSAAARSAKPLAGELLPKPVGKADRPSRISDKPTTTYSQIYKDKSEVVLEGVTRELWSTLCLKIAEGVKTNDALKELGIKQTVYRAIMREDRACQEQVISARADWDNRNWPEELIEEICILTAQNYRQKDIARKLNFSFHAFQQLCMRDDYVNEMYMRAMQIQAFGLIDEATEIADDDKEDICFGAQGEKPNTAAVQRANLRVKHRQWTAQKVLRDIYGDVQKIEADVNLSVNLAERLDNARKRKERAFREMKDVN